MKQYIVDAFADKVFSGNPAAVCILDTWLSEELMMSITKENNLSETAFAVKSGDRYKLRWFTPGGEIDLCGHATLATAYVIMNYYENEKSKIIFDTLSGELIVEKKGDLYEMEFPVYKLEEVLVTKEMEDALGCKVSYACVGRDLLCVIEDEEVVRNLQPDFEKIRELDGLLLHVTAQGTKYDCVSRSFAPKLNVSEDPVCGSGHCHIGEYWKNKLKKSSLVAYQASKRGGTLYCEVGDETIKLSGKAAVFSEAELLI